MTHDHSAEDADEPIAEADARLAALLRDLLELQGYLEERGQHTYRLAQQFLRNANQDAAARAYDERQATMLEYQHYIWLEIAGRVNQLVMAYTEASTEDGTEATATGAGESS